MYQSLEAELHDAFWEAEGPPAELPLLRDFLKHHPGLTLELGCGSGRLLLPLFKEGFQIEGLDNAPEMIRLCEKAAKNLTPPPKLHCCDLFALPRDHFYQAIAIPAFTLQLLPDPIASIQRVADLLSPEGGLYFSVFYPYAELENELPENEFYPDHNLTLPDGRTAQLTTKHSIDRTTQILTRIHRYEILQHKVSEKIHESTQIIRYCTEDDWKNLLDATGFQIKEIIHDFDREENDPEETAGVITFLAMKK